MFRLARFRCIWVGLGWVGLDLIRHGTGTARATYTEQVMHLCPDLEAGLVEHVHLVRLLGEQPVHHHRFRLADAVGSCLGLRQPKTSSQPRTERVGRVLAACHIRLSRSWAGKRRNISIETVENHNPKPTQPTKN